MGLSVTKSEFTPEEFVHIAAKVYMDLTAFSRLLERPGFGEGKSSIGAEVEFYIVNSDLCVHPINTDIAASVQDPQLTVELNRFNLEYNLSPQAFKGNPFARTEQELLAAIQRINQHAAPLDGELVPIGILPTLRESDTGPEAMTDEPRYHALSDALIKQRGEPFSIPIGGNDVIDLEADDVTMEGANTSFQLHWRVPADRFADYFNAVQLVTPIVLALVSNSPSLFGHHLWDETRIALFKQCIDSRSPNRRTWRHPPRVYFGNGWARSAWELFAASASLYPPILPLMSEEDPMAVLDRGEVPQLAENIYRLPNIRLRGLMAIPAPSTDFEHQRMTFERLAAALASLQQMGIACDTLSMGMTQDMSAAIAAGSTLVRIGHEIFGERY